MLDLLEFSLLDMTPYDRQTWFNLVGDYNAAIWPAYLAAFVLTLALLRALFKVAGQTAGSKWSRAPLAILAAGWIWTGAIFHLYYFAQLNWAASWFGLAFIAQGVLLLAAAVLFKPAWAALSSPKGRLALLLLVMALVIYPLSGLAEGRSLAQLEWLPLLPTPVTLLTFAALILFQPRWRHSLIIIPIGWAVISAAFATTLGLLELYFLIGAIITWVLSLFIKTKTFG